jgi:hypothetical protein
MMNLDTYPFPMIMVDVGAKKILRWIDQPGTAKGKNVVVSDELRNRMIKPRPSEP